MMTGNHIGNRFGVLHIAYFDQLTGVERVIVIVPLRQHIRRALANRVSIDRKCT